MNRQVKSKQDIIQDFDDNYPSIKERADKIAATMSDAQATLEHLVEHNKIQGDAKPIADDLLSLIQQFNDENASLLETLRFDVDPNGDFDTQTDLLIEISSNFRLPYAMVAKAQEFYEAVEGNVEESQRRTDELFNDE